MRWCRVARLWTERGKTEGAADRLSNDHPAAPFIAGCIGPGGTYCVDRVLTLG